MRNNFFTRRIDTFHVRDLKQLHFTNKNKRLEIVNKFTYLEILFSTSGKFNEAIKICGRHLLPQSLSKICWEKSNQTLGTINLFSIVQAIALYESECWGAFGAYKLGKT